MTAVAVLQCARVECPHGFKMPFGTVAVGRFDPAGPRGYRALSLPDGPIRATRAEAEADHCAAFHGERS